MTTSYLLYTFQHTYLRSIRLVVRKLLMCKRILNIRKRLQIYYISISSSVNAFYDINVLSLHIEQLVCTSIFACHTLEVL